MTTENTDNENKLNQEEEVFEAEILETVETEEAEELAEGEEEASVDSQKGSNKYLRTMMESNFIEYASYVIKERAIPDVDDGFKPVQRRILWSLSRMDDGKFHKVANVIGHTMQYHPHGDASIGDALVVLANKEYFIEKQGNFGNILTGDGASAARYIECRLSPLGREVLFNNDITEFIDSYDGRNKEPVVLPVKIPSMLMLGADGIAVGMATRIMPHNFSELLNGQIAVLQNEPFEIYPDFLQGGMMDVSEYDGGNGKITLRAKIDIDGRKLIIREIPATTTTESLIASIEKAVEKNKIKVTSINDYTAEEVEIEIVPMRGQDPEKMLQALYAYTNCSISVTVNMMVICDNRPVQMDVDSVVRRNTEKLLEYLRRELEIELGKLEELYHGKTLAQIFIENRIYKRIEECESFDLVMSEVYKGLEPFTHMLKREITDDDIQKLLAIPIRRISLFDIKKNQKDIEDILAQMDQVQKNLKHLKAYAIKYLTSLLEKYGALFPRRTHIETFDKIDRSAAALNNIKVGWDRKNGYIGTNVKSDDQVTCNEFDHLLCVERKGDYKVINIPDKIFIGRLYDFRKYDKEIEFGVIYRDNKTGKFYAKRCVIDKFITDREYNLCPKGCRLEVFTPRTDAIYSCSLDAKRKDAEDLEINLKEFPLRTPKARGLLISSKRITKINHLRYLEPEELQELAPDTPNENDDENFPDTGSIQNDITEVSDRRKAPEPEAAENEVEEIIPKETDDVQNIEALDNIKDDDLEEQEKPGDQPEENSDKNTAQKKDEPKEVSEKKDKEQQKKNEPKEVSEKKDKPVKKNSASKSQKTVAAKAKDESPEPQAPKEKTVQTETKTEDSPAEEKSEEKPAPQEPNKENLDAKPEENIQDQKPDTPETTEENWGIIQPEFGF